MMTWDDFGSEIRSVNHSPQVIIPFPLASSREPSKIIFREWNKHITIHLGQKETVSDVFYT